MLGTATAKRTDVAEAILDAHGLTDYFEAVNGTDDRARTKSRDDSPTPSTSSADPDPPRS